MFRCVGISTLTALALLGLLVVAPAPVAGQGDVERNVVYGMFSGLALTMDVYRPNEPIGIGVVVIPGSGWHNAGRGYADPQLKDGYGPINRIRDGLVDAGFTVVADPVKIPKVGVQFNFLVEDAEGGQWYVDVSGAFTTVRPGLMRTDTLWKTLGRIHVLRATDEPQNPSRVLVLTSNLPKANSEGDKALRAVGPDQVWDAVEMLRDILDTGSWRDQRFGAAGAIS